MPLLRGLSARGAPTCYIARATRHGRRGRGAPRLRGRRANEWHVHR